MVMSVVTNVKDCLPALSQTIACCNKVSLFFFCFFCSCKLKREVEKQNLPPFSFVNGFFCLTSVEYKQCKKCVNNIVFLSNKNLFSF